MLEFASLIFLYIPCTCSISRCIIFPIVNWFARVSTNLQQGWSKLTPSPPIKFKAKYLPQVIITWLQNPKVDLISYDLMNVCPVNLM